MKGPIMNITRHEKALKRLLTNLYVHKTTIRDALRCSYEKANEIFHLAKQEELKRSMIDVRPNAVQSNLVLKVSGLDRNFMKKQFDELLELKKQVKD